MTNDCKYRKLKAGEIIKETDEYTSPFDKGKYVKVRETVVGQPLLLDNVKFYRRKL